MSLEHRVTVIKEGNQYVASCGGYDDIKVYGTMFVDAVDKLEIEMMKRGVEIRKQTYQINKWYGF